jgi:hypothetical protein
MYYANVGVSFFLLLTIFEKFQTLYGSTTVCCNAHYAVYSSSLIWWSYSVVCIKFTVVYGDFGKLINNPNIDLVFAFVQFEPLCNLKFTSHLPIIYRCRISNRVPLGWRTNLHPSDFSGVRLTYYLNKDYRLKYWVPMFMHL